MSFAVSVSNNFVEQETAELNGWSEYVNPNAQKLVKEWEITQSIEHL